MARAQLLLSAELERAFADAQSGGVRFVKASIEGETFALAGVGAASADVRGDAARVAASELAPTSAAFVLFCLDVNAPALRWVLLAFVPEAVSVRDKMLYSSSRESLKKQLGHNYFVGEFHATDVDAKKKHAADAPLSETERLLKETALLERDTNVKSTAMGVIPFAISQNVREKLALFKDGKFDWIAMKLNTDDESVEVVKSLESVDLVDVQGAVDQKAPSFVTYRYRGALAASKPVLIFLYVCPEEAPVRQKMVYSTCKATVLAATSELGLEFDKTKTDEELKAREFSRPAAPGRGRGRGRGRGPSGASAQ
ncbi:hypothetical protein PybrP1_009203 [[Pythium] brassicae (nom. inval.)]|nr:hypothetical protein PybrP1_009203 [[Pythium] brassicae (nom. inval.)]